MPHNWSMPSWILFLKEFDVNRRAKQIISVFLALQLALTVANSPISSAARALGTWGAPPVATAETSPAQRSLDVPASMPTAKLRTALAMLLGEHVLLMASATSAALAGRPADFEAAIAAVDANAVDLAAAISSIYGDITGETFLAFWRAHVGCLVDYTIGIATNHQSMSNEALHDLTQYASDFGVFLVATNPNLSHAAVEAALLTHINTMIAVINTQAEADPMAALTALRAAYAHMDVLATILAQALTTQSPTRFAGTADSPAANLRARLTLLFAEHAYLASLATDAALAGRTAEYAAANTVLNDNSQDLAAVIGSLYGDANGEAFLALWRTQIGFFVDYTLGVATADPEMQGHAIADLTAYAQALGAFLESVNPNLPRKVVTQALVPHINSVRTLINAQAAADGAVVYQQLRASYAHMQTIADIFSDAIIIQFPSQFGGAPHEDMPQAAMITATEMISGIEMMKVELIAASEMTTASAVISDSETRLGIDMVLAAAATMDHAVAAAPITNSAAQLRSTLALLLGEHVLLVASATDATLRGRTPEFEAAVIALDGNSVDLAAVIGSIDGADGEAAFLARWRQQIGFLFVYTTAVATNDQAQAQQALANLAQAATDLGTFLATTNPNLPTAAVADLLHTHVTTLIRVIDAQATLTIHASGDQQVAYPALQAAYAHMDQLAAALAAGIAAQRPEQFPGDANSAAASLRATLNMVLAEHSFLVVKSAAAALVARNIEFEAAAGALDQNSQHIAAVVGSVYGEEAGAAFLPLWRKHIGYFIDYTLAQIADDRVARSKAADELTAYAGELAAFLESSNPNLPAALVTDLVTIHAATTLAVIDAADSADPTAFYVALRAAYAHMAMLANPLSDAMLVQFPAQFGVSTGDATAAIPSVAAVSIPIVIDAAHFMPNRIEVPVGATVVWTNQDAVDHTVTSGRPDNPAGRFASGLFGQDKQFSFTFTEVGEFEYFCETHTDMRGLVVVIPAQ